MVATAVYAPNRPPALWNRVPVHTNDVAHQSEERHANFQFCGQFSELTPLYSDEQSSQVPTHLWSSASSNSIKQSVFLCKYLAQHAENPLTDTSREVQSFLPCQTLCTCLFVPAGYPDTTGTTGPSSIKQDKFPTISLDYDHQEPGT